MLALAIIGMLVTFGLGFWLGSLAAAMAFIDPPKDVQHVLTDRWATGTSLACSCDGCGNPHSKTCPCQMGRLAR